VLALEAHGKLGREGVRDRRHGREWRRRARERLRIARGNREAARGLVDADEQRGAYVREGAGLTYEGALDRGGAVGGRRG
jgi:hypothetical protein